jgi:hypothetical protein
MARIYMRVLRTCMNTMHEISTPMAVCEKIKFPCKIYNMYFAPIITNENLLYEKLPQAYYTIYCII